MGHTSLTEIIKILQEQLDILLLTLTWVSNKAEEMTYKEWWMFSCIL